MKILAADTGNVAAFFNDDALEQITQEPSLKKLSRETFHMKALLSFPLLLENGKTFSFCFYSRSPDAYSTEHISLLHRLEQTLLKIIRRKPVAENAGANTRSLNGKDEPSTNDTAGANAFDFEGIVGSSHLMLNVFDHITQVAPFDTSVLILGESGTGKERIADCIRNLSSRTDKPFIKVNCAALPSTLIESELFGHEKGSFTGALDKRIGKFEKADKGTIFLDEIGEMPLDLQVKLLRVLQEKYIERIGAKDVTKVDVRIIAATNRNLEKKLQKDGFVFDLYYRLNVFPIELPPLQRPEDIPDLTSYFIDHYNRKAGKKITGVSDKVLRSMLAYSWPGNIRELENLIERSVLLAKGTIIEDISLPTQTSNISPNAQDSYVKTIHENERDHIISVLKKCNGKIWGAGGAAEVLNLPPSTLKSKMKKLGIQKESID